MVAFLIKSRSMCFRLREKMGPQNYKNTCKRALKIIR